MPYKRSDQEREAHNSLMYPGPEPRVPVNKLNARTWRVLEKFEAQLVAIRVKRLPADALELSYEGFKRLHHHLFQDVYVWAGEERRYTTTRNKEVPFARPEYIERSMEIEFAKLRKANFLRGADAETFSSMAASFAVEINAAHPFVEGNGRAQRLFLQILADQAGYELTLLPSDKNAWNAAAKEGFFSNPDAMKRLIMARLKKK